MKSLIAAASTAAVALAAPMFAHAQDASHVGLYGTLGYDNTHGDDVDLGAIQGRLGWRATPNLGVEGEFAAGVKNDKVTVAPGVDAKVKLDHQEAIYGVGFLPMTPQWDLLGRVGYGHSKISASALGNTVEGDGDSWNFGVGAQYHLDPNNGVRADYTREEFVSGDGHADVWSIAYARHF
jgi:opacity protein-like surface antigen